MPETELGVNEQMPILRKSRLSTGIADLDIILEGGYQNPANLMITGPTGMEKAAFAYHFITAAPANENAYVICGTSSPDDIKKKAMTLGINLNKENITFIDCYSSTIGKAVESTEKVKVVTGPGALNDLSLTLNEAMRASAGKRMRIVFDTLSTFVLYNPRDSIRKFLGVIEGRLKGAGATTVYLVDEGVHDKQLISILEQGMDGSYSIVDRGGKFFLSVPEVDVGIPIRVGPTGIIIM